MSGLDYLARGLAAQAKVAALRPRYADWMGMRPLGGLMQTPPTITVGNATSLSGGFFYPAASGSGFYNITTSLSNRMSFTRGGLAAVPVGEAVTFDNVTVSNPSVYSRAGVGFSFMHFGSAFELIMVGSTAYRVRINDEYVSLVPQSTSGYSPFHAKYDFGTPAWRRVDVIGDALYVIGVIVGANDSLDPVALRGPRCIVLGDSFTTNASDGWVAQFADAMGWDDVWPSGVGGTGYLATAGGAAPKYRDRVEHDIVQYAPDVVLVSGSVNDDAFTAAQVGAEATLLYSALRSALPDALIVAATTATGGVGRCSANKLATKDSLKAQAEAEGVLWIDPLETPICFATGTAISGTVRADVTAGATTIDLSGGAGALNNPQPGSTIEIGTGASCERVQVKTYYQSTSGIVTADVGDPLQYAHAVDEPWVQVGGSYLTGVGNVAAPTGFGNSDLFVSGDGVHPTALGHEALGTITATLLRAAFV